MLDTWIAARGKRMVPGWNGAYVYTRNKPIHNAEGLGHVWTRHESGQGSKVGDIRLELNSASQVAVRFKSKKERELSRVFVVVRMPSGDRESLGVMRRCAHSCVGVIYLPGGAGLYENNYSARRVEGVPFIFAPTLKHFL